MAPATTIVLYPQGTTFNMDYYMSTHMPLVQKNWGPHGLKKWTVIQYPSEAPYCVQATLEWDSLDDQKKALASEGTAEVMGDVPKFSDKTPVLMTGEHVGSS